MAKRPAKTKGGLAELIGTKTNRPDMVRLLAVLNTQERALLEHNLLGLKPELSPTEIKSNETDYVRQPPTMAQFIDDDYFLGRTLRASEDNIGLYPGWREILCRDFNLGSMIHNVVVTGSLGIGKCWCAGTELLMYDGTLRRVEDIVDGDLLMGDDSTPRRVLRTATGTDETFTIYPVRGEPFTVNADHILVLKSTVSDAVEEVSVRDFLNWPRDRRHKACLYRVAVDWPKKELPIDPYAMGLWLGDGHTYTTALTTADPEIEEAWIACGRSFGLQPTYRSCGKNGIAHVVQLSYRDETGVVRKRKNGLRNAFQQLGLMPNHKKLPKFIPQVYLTGNRQDRLQLLAGLLDTDGHKVKGQEGTYDLTLAVKDLADQVRFLAHSLGFYAKTSIKVVNATAYFRTTICGAYDVPVRLGRKMSNAYGASRGVSNLTGDAYRNDPLRSRFAVIPAGRQAYYGFTLDGNGRCLLRDMTVTHNTYILVVIMLYRIALTTMLRNPQNFFGISRGSNIIFNFLSVTRETVRQTAFGEALNFMSASPFFIDVLKFNPEMEYSKSIIEFPNNIFLTAGSKGWHVLGRNVIGVGLDEGNFRLEQNPDEKAYALYDQVRTRIANRFRKTEGFMPAISIIASSASDESSFTETVIREIEQANEPKAQVVYRQPVYKIKRHELKLGRRWFKVAYGLRNQDPFVMAGFYLEDGQPIEEDGPHEQPPQGARTELVPEMYLADFRRNCRSNLQAVSGISTGGSHRLFSSMIDVERCIELSEKEGIVTPLKANIRYIPVSVEDNLNIWDYMVHSNFLTRVDSRVVPKRHRQRLRYAHLDLATTSKAGVSICHLVGGKRVEGIIRAGLPFDEYRLQVEYDFILTITAGQNKPINFDKICQFFFWLRDMCGFRFGKITADWFQCLAAGTRVWTSRGTLPIEQICKGDQVQSGLGLLRSVTGVKAYCGAPTLTLTTSDKDQITGTPNHRLAVWRRSLVPGSKSCAAQFAWVRMDQIRVGDVLQRVSLQIDSPYVSLSEPPVIEHEHGCRLARWSAPSVLTEALAEWLGLIFGDGSMSLVNGFRLTVKWSDMNDACGVFDRLFGFQPKFAPRTETCGSIGFVCRSVYRWLKSCGLAKPDVDGKRKGNRPELRIPEPIFRSPRAVKAAFLRGLFSADGNVGDGISLSTKHADLARDVLLLLREFAIDACLVPSSREVFGKRTIQWHVKLRGPRALFRPIGFCYQSKQAQFDATSGTPGRNLYVTVTSIARGHGDVYDVEVETDHSYVANGFVSHNSEMPLQTLEAGGFEVDKQSLDKDKAAYVAWRTGFEDLRMRLYRSDELLEEAEKLVELDKKFDHPANGSKDTSDSAAGAYYNAINSEERTMLLTEAVPSVHSYAGMEGQSAQSQLTNLELPLPSRTYRTVKLHEM